MPDKGLSTPDTRHPTPVDLKAVFNLPPEKAVAYFKSKGYAFSWDWHEVYEQAHAKAFTVAKAMRMDVLSDIREMVQKALDEGITFAQFKKELTPKLQAKGWWGKKLVGDTTVSGTPIRRQDGERSVPLTSTVGGKTVQLGSPYRLRTIYQTNLQSAYMTGRYKAFAENVQNRPYWQYVAVLDSRTRPAHRILHGKVFRADDPFWDTHYPPNGWRCRCRVRALSEGNVTKLGLTPESSEGTLHDEPAQINSRGDERPVTVYTDPKTKLTMHPDPGFNFNQGKTAFFPDLDRYDYGVAKTWVKGGLTGPDFRAFYARKVKGDFPVAVLAEEYKAAIGAQSQTVYLSDGSLSKNIRMHPELALADYQGLPDVVQAAQLIVQDGENTFVFFRKGQKVYYGAIKTTRTGETNFLTSFRLARQSDIDVIRKKGKILKDEL
jgi:SPP1 gp7 family putative phage head morphogenesis protein